MPRVSTTSSPGESAESNTYSVSLGRTSSVLETRLTSKSPLTPYISARRYFPSAVIFIVTGAESVLAKRRSLCEDTMASNEGAT